ncbi:MAG: M23 family metallopeptidase [Desulfobacterales bacterium]|nr:M23 family metallopeptidase [Desulfobacterales bacterium]
MLEISFVTVVGQIFLPLALVVRLWRVGCRSRGEWLLNALSVAAYLALIAVVGIWLPVPWYLPFGFALLALAAAAASWRRCGRSLPSRKASSRDGFRTWRDLLLAGFCAGTLAWALSGFEPPAGSSLDLASPLKNGEFYVVNGGSAYRAQSYAVDIVRLDRFGRRADGWWPADLTRYYVFGEPVYAPCSGLIARTESRWPDLTPPDQDRQHPAGNYVLLECGEAAVLLAHLMQSSVAVSAGQRVVEGERIGRVGNSGLSTEPHLHLHAQQRSNTEEFLAGAPLPFRIDGRTPVRGSRINSNP